MIKFVFVFLFAATNALAFVPTVESLFRHGANPDVTTNGLALTFTVRKIQPGSNLNANPKEMAVLNEQKAQDFYRIFFTKVNNDTLKIAQTRYSNNSYSEASLEHKIYYPNFTPYTLKPTVEQQEKGLFFSLLHSMTFNNGSHLIHYLKTLGVPVKLNSEIINRSKVDQLANYKHYLATISKDRHARKTEVNPLRPDDPSSRERIENLMNESMYVDTKQVKLSREEGQMAWLITAGPFEAVVSYKEREVQRFKYKSASGEFEIICKDYWLANGTHSLPRYLLIRDFSGDSYQVEITNLRQYPEREDELVGRLRKWDQILKGKESPDPRPEFLL